MRDEIKRQPSDVCNDAAPLWQVAGITRPKPLEYIPGHTYINREVSNTMIAAVTKYNDVSPLTLAAQVADVTIPHSVQQHRV